MKKFISYDSNGNIVAFVNSSSSIFQSDPNLSWIEITHHPDREKLTNNAFTNLNFKIKKSKNGEITIKEKTNAEKSASRLSRPTNARIAQEEQVKTSSNDNISSVQNTP